MYISGLLWTHFAIQCYRIKLKQKKDQEKAKREDRRVVMAVDEFLKVNCNIVYNEGIYNIWIDTIRNEYSTLIEIQ